MALGAQQTSQPRPLRFADALPVRIMEREPVEIFQLDEHKFATNLRKSRRVSVGHDNTDHLQPEGTPTSSSSDTRSPSTGCQRHHPIGADDGLPEAKWWSERNCGGDIVRRLVALTMAQQFSTPVQSATAPHQCVMSTRQALECVAHALQVLREVDALTTVVSKEG